MYVQKHNLPLQEEHPLEVTTSQISTTSQQDPATFTMHIIKAIQPGLTP
jgi:hypothetical protein